MDPIEGIFCLGLTLRAIKSYSRVEQPVIKHLNPSFWSIWLTNNQQKQIRNEEIMTLQSKEGQKFQNTNQQTLQRSIPEHPKN
jgi:hypothetical protein